MPIFIPNYRKMTAIDILKNKLIDKVLATNNKKLLKAIDSIFESTGQEEKILLSSEQIEMLAMSEAEIEKGEVISEEELDKMDEGWLS